MDSYAVSIAASFSGSDLYSSFLRSSAFLIASASAPCGTPSAFQGSASEAPPAAAEARAKCVWRARGRPLARRAPNAAAAAATRAAGT